MSMDRAYEQLHQAAIDLEHHVHDAYDDPRHPSVGELNHEMRELVVDFVQQKKPRNIEDRIKKIMSLLHQARSEGETFMSTVDAVNYFDRFEDMRRAIRSHEHYS